MKKVSDILRIRITANILYRINREFKIEYKETEIYDMVVTSNKDSFRFAVKVGSSTYSESRAFTEYINILKSNAFMKDSERVPIILICVNESTEEARMGIVLGWRYLNPVIYEQARLQIVNTHNWSIFEEYIRKMDSVIRILSEKKIRVIKRIIINDVDNRGRTHTANIIYLRTFSNEYKMHQKKVVDKKEEFNRMFWGIPENEYPSDMLDKDLLEEVKNIYPKAKVKSNLILLNNELIDFEREIENYNSHNTITFMLEPDINEVGGFVNYFDCLKFQFHLYVSSKIEKEYFGDIYLSKSLPLNEFKRKFEYYLQIRNSVISPEKYFLIR